MQARAHVVFEFEPFAQSNEQFGALKARLVNAEVGAMSHSALEELIRCDGMELMRRLLQDHLSLRAVQERERGLTGPVVGADDVQRTHQRSTERQLMSVFGPVRVPRLAYSGRGTTSLHPLDAALNLPSELYSHGVRKLVAQEAAKVSFDETVTAIHAHSGAEVAKRQVEQLTTRAAADFEAFYDGRLALASSAIRQSSELLILSVDGKGIIMRKESLRDATRKTADNARHKLQHRLSKGEKLGRKRMATVAAAYTIAPFPRVPEDIVKDLSPVRKVPIKRPKPEAKRVWARIDKPMEQVIDDLFAEGMRRDPKRSKTWVALVDGNDAQLQLLRRKAFELGIELTVIVDVIHVLEYLWDATTAFNDDGTNQAELWVQERFLEVLRGKASHVAAGMRRSATLRDLAAEQRKRVDRCADYILNHTPYLHYDVYLENGFPIATGVIEGACRHLVKDRMDITGARWGLLGAEAVLRLRSLRASGDFDDYWAFHEARELERNHTSRFATNRPHAVPGRSKAAYA
jgi:hypothetical protein